MSDGKQAADQEIRVQDLWAKYEDIAMHFNDLLMRLRSRSIAGIAALSTLVGIFTKNEIGAAHLDWHIAESIFIAMAFFWIAVWCLDLLYYNRLLTGAVAAVKDLEAQTRPGQQFTAGITMSTVIEEEFGHSIWTRWPSRFHGVLLFYAIVLAVIIAGAIYAHGMHRPAAQSSSPLALRVPQ